MQGPREKLAYQGVEFLSNSELMAVILGKGTRGKNVIPLAQEIVTMIENSPDIISVKDLITVRGIGTSKACQIIAALEFSRRFLCRAVKSPIKSPKDAVPYLSALKEARQEEFVVLTLDGANAVIGTHFVTRGLVNQSQVHPRETFYPAIKDGAVNILLAHNHPSGNLDPSSADLTTTSRMAEISRTMGIGIMDHLIISSRGYTSIREKYPQYFL